MKKILIFIVFLLSISQIQAQTTNTATVTTKASATLASTCTMSAQNVNFGQLSLPISSQSSTSNMSVLCTKGSSSCLL